MPKDTTPKIHVPFPDEPGAVEMTPQQWELFKQRHGEACAFYLCEQAEAYNDQYPKRWQKYRDHFRTLNHWHQMKVAEGYEFFEHPTAGPGYYRDFVVRNFRNPQGVRR